MAKSLFKIKLQALLRCSVTKGLVACICNSATFETEVRNGVGLILVGGNSPSIGEWIVDHL